MGLLLDLPTVEAGQAPHLPHVYLPRPILWTRLETSTRAGTTVVVAPAGAGKTLGVAGWVRHDPARGDTVWLNAHRRSDLDQLCEYLDRAGEHARGVGRPAGLVVVDDAHLLPPSVLTRVDLAIAEHPTGIRLVLLARWDLPLERLLPELLGSLTVLRGDTLRLDLREAALLVRTHARTGSDAVVDAITSRGQGWCAALVLASRAAAAATDAEAFAERYRDVGSPVDNLVAAEVFATLTSQQRHLLLCTASEQEVTVDLAQRLTGNPRVGEVLVSLESTGLLVTRETVQSPSGPARWPEDVRFHIHPLLREVARLRLVAGGVDVEQARATVRRSVADDVARGEIAPAFDRLVVLQQLEQALTLFAPHSITLALGPNRAQVAELARRGAALVHDHAEWWLSIALERRIAGDVSSYRHWLRRIVARRPVDPDPEWSRNQCAARLALARFGLEPVRPALDQVREADLAGTDALGAVIALELGAAESWVGDLDAAARHLTAAVTACRTHTLDLLVPIALSQLAVTLLTQGRDHVAGLVAEEALASGTDEPAACRIAHERARMALELARLDTDLAGTLSTAGPGSVPSPPARPLVDPMDRVWQRVLAVQRLVRAGLLNEAQRLLECPLEVPALPRHLELVVLGTRARLAFLLRDQPRLRSAASGFVRLNDSCGALWAEAAGAEVADRRTLALQLYRRAVATTTPDPSGTRQLCRVSAAQLLEREGSSAEADRLMARALVLSERDQDPAPFLGWSLRGADVVVLLERALQRNPSAWVEQLHAAAERFPGLHVHFAQAHVSRNDRDQASEVVVRPVLSQREREVLNELARGATYADVAANLFVSENTVKTHVSSLYSKLGVGRRSGALAVARKLNLL